LALRKTYEQGGSIPEGKRIVPELTHRLRVMVSISAAREVVGHCHRQEWAHKKAAVSTWGTLVKVKDDARLAPRTKRQAHLCGPSTLRKVNASAAPSQRF